MKTRLKLPPFAEEKGAVNVIVECPKGGRNKYTLDEKTGFLTLSKILPSGMVFPFNFGSIPATLGGDGDPLDILILLTEPVHPLCVVQAHLLGVIKAEQVEDGKRERNDRLIGTAIYKQKPAEQKDIKDVNQQTLCEIEAFFVSYNQLAGKQFKALAYEGAESALKLVKKAHQQFMKSK